MTPSICSLLHFEPELEGISVIGTGTSTVGYDGGRPYA